MNQENYCALALSIIDGCFPETAFAKLEHEHPAYVKAIILPEDVYWMDRYRAKGLTYEQIGKIYGLSMHVVYSRIKRRRAKKKTH